jgi:hypothetical protein
MVAEAMLKAVVLAPSVAIRTGALRRPPALAVKRVSPGETNKTRAAEVEVAPEVVAVVLRVVVVVIVPVAVAAGDSADEPRGFIHRGLCDATAST